MKQLCVISCPIDTYSGYGARARDFFKALHELKKDEYEFIVISQRWGSTPWGYIKDNVEEWGWVLSMIFNSTQLPKQPDIWIQVTVPNEFQPIGKYNIGVTAGIETTLCDGSWLEGINRMDTTLVSSKHAKSVFENSVFEKKDTRTGQTQVVKLEKPVQVLFEGVDLEKYFHIEAYISLCSLIIIVFLFFFGLKIRLRETPRALFDIHHAAPPLPLIAHGLRLKSVVFLLQIQPDIRRGGVVPGTAQGLRLVTDTHLISISHLGFLFCLSINLPDAERYMMADDLIGEDFKFDSQL
jgi:hypothetical protein